jgi:hypothetical protein
MNRKITGSPYGWAASDMDETPASGITTRGNKDVTGIGTGSVIHHKIIQAPMDTTVEAAPGKTDSGSESFKSINRSGPPAIVIFRIKEGFIFQNKSLKGNPKLNYPNTA